MELLTRSQVCVDASFYLTILLPDEDDSVSRPIWQEWQDAGVELCAPHLFAWECANAVRQAVRTDRMSPARARRAIMELTACPVSMVDVDEHVMVAWREFVVPYDLPAVYDASYLALADWFDCELWTADRRLYRTVGHELSWVKLIGVDA